MDLCSICTASQSIWPTSSSGAACRAVTTSSWRRSCRRLPRSVRGLSVRVCGGRACCLSCLSCRRNRLACVVSGSLVRRARGATTLHVHALVLASAPSRHAPLSAVYPEPWPYVFVVARFAPAVSGDALYRARTEECRAGEGSRWIQSSRQDGWWRERRQRQRASWRGACTPRISCHYPGIRG